MRLHIFTIGGKKFGFGHLARMVPIHDIFTEKGVYTKFYVDGDETIERILCGKNYQITNWLDIGLDSISSTDIVIIDTLQFPFSFHNRIKQKTTSIYFICDDYLDKELPIPVINWRVNSNKNRLKTNELFGEKLVPLRKEIFKYRNEIKNSGEIIISMGGSDVLNLLLPTIEILIQQYDKSISIKAIISKYHRDYSILLKKYGNIIKLLPDLNTNELFKEMSSSMFAIASGGHSIYELAFVGTPTIHVLVVDNQRPALEWNKTGFTYPIGWYNKDTYMSNIISGVNYFIKEDNCKQASNIGKNIIDGKGAERIYNSLINRL